MTFLKRRNLVFDAKKFLSLTFLSHIKSRLLFTLIFQASNSLPQEYAHLEGVQLEVSSKIQTHMHVQVKTHIGSQVEHSREVVERIIEQNMKTKLDNYLKKFDTQDAEGMIDVSVDKNKKGLFDAKIQANLDGKSFRFEREDYKNLDDILNHLFDHFKEALSDM